MLGEFAVYEFNEISYLGVGLESSRTDNWERLTKSVGYVFKSRAVKAQLFFCLFYFCGIHAKMRIHSRSSTLSDMYSIFRCERAYQPQLDII